MENELVSNSGGTVTPNPAVTMAANTSPEIDEIAQEFAQFEKDFDINVMDEAGATQESNKMTDAISGSVFEAPNQESDGAIGLLALADGEGGDGQEGWFRDRFKPIVRAIAARAKSIIQKMINLAHRLGKYRGCISKIVAAINAFKAKKFGTAIRYSVSAFRCIQAA